MAIPLEGGRAQSPARKGLSASAFLIATALAAWRTFASAWARRREARALQALDDALLKDIGLSRCGIDWSIRNGRSASGIRLPDRPISAG